MKVRPDALPGLSRSSTMECLTLPDGHRVSYDKTGEGPPLVLVHGCFSDHHTNWELVKPALGERFTVCAIARRGRGETAATQRHSLLDEAEDVAALVRSLGSRVFLLGHSYGAHCALAAAALVPDRVQKLVLYEPPWPVVASDEAMATLERLARAGDWEQFALFFFRERLFVPVEELEELRETELWPPILADAEATLEDLRALNAYRFGAERFADLSIPVLLQVGAQSPRRLYVTDALASALPDARIAELAGQAHEGMTTAPEMYVQNVCEFFQGGARPIASKSESDGQLARAAASGAGPRRW